MGVKYSGQAVLFKGTPDEAWGACQTQEVAQEADKTTWKNGAGNTAGVMWTDVGRKKFTGTYTPYAGVADSPVLEEDLIGEELTMKINDGTATLKIHIDNAKISGSSGGIPTFNIDGYYYPAIDGTAAPSGT